MSEIVWPPVALIIPNFNGAALLRGNLPSVLAAAAIYPGDCEVIVVDDASSDDSVAVLEREFPVARLVRHAENRGFSAAIHSGVEAARAEFLILINSDVRPDADFITPLVRHLERPEVFSVTPLIVDGQGRVTEEAWRCYVIRRGRLRLIKLCGRVPPRRVETAFASGGSMALRKARFVELGGFAPIFQPFYSEDADLGLRAWRRGWVTLFEPGCRVVHDHAGSSINTHVPSFRVRRIRRRNQFLFEWIHLPARDLFGPLLPGYARQILGRLLRLDFAYFGGLGAALGLLPRVFALRAEIEKTQRLGFWDIMSRVEDSLRAIGDNEDGQP
jgi:GT2 family glycosyltransferase